MWITALKLDLSDIQGDFPAGRAAAGGVVLFGFLFRQPLGSDDPGGAVPAHIASFLRGVVGLAVGAGGSGFGRELCGVAYRAGEGAAGPWGELPAASDGQPFGGVSERFAGGAGERGVALSGALRAFRDGGGAHQPGAPAGERFDRGASRALPRSPGPGIAAAGQPALRQHRGVRGVCGPRDGTPQPAGCGATCGGTAASFGAAAGLPGCGDGGGSTGAAACNTPLIYVDFSSGLFLSLRDGRVLPISGVRRLARLFGFPARAAVVKRETQRSLRGRSRRCGYPADGPAALAPGRRPTPCAGHTGHRFPPG